MATITDDCDHDVEDRVDDENGDVVKFGSNCDQTMVKLSQ